MSRTPTTSPSGSRIRAVNDLALSPVEVAQALSEQPGMVFLDSATAGHLSRDTTSGPDTITGAGHSLVAARPVEIVCGNIADPTPLREALERHRPATTSKADLGFPVGGAIGSIDYEGDYCFGIYPQVMVFDHQSERWSESGRLSELVRAGSDRHGPPAPVTTRFQSGWSRQRFCDAVEKAQDYITAGDIYQVNLSQRFTASWPEAAIASDAAPGCFDFYRRLRQVSPAPYAAYLDLGGRQVMSSSPELFLELSGSLARTRPIKGTRPRFRDPECDEKSAYDLITSPKEVAELIMITDLERNDLGRVCEYGSVQVTELLKLERHEHVFHLVSTVEGQLRSDVDHLDAIAASFPGGSITGAPKKRAMEIIQELEQAPRGLYTGAIGIIGFDGETRLSIAIRTAIAEAGELHFHVGAGIVADSDPQLEYEETLHKARGLFAACEPV